MYHRIQNISWSDKIMARQITQTSLFLQQEKLLKCNAKAPFVWDFQNSRESQLCLLCMQWSIPLPIQRPTSLGSSRPVCNCTDNLLGYSLSCACPVTVICECTGTPIWPKCIKFTKHISNNCRAYVFLKVLHLLRMCYTEPTHMILFRKAQEVVLKYVLDVVG